MDAPLPHEQSTQAPARSTAPAGEPGAPLDGATGPTLSDGLVKTSAAHQGFTLTARAFAVFGIIFVVLYSTDFWFGTDLRWWAIPAVLLSLVITHFLLLFVESDRGCSMFSLIWRGAPPIVYRNWVTINDPNCHPGIKFGVRNVVWSAMQELELTRWGNLLVHSAAVSGTTSAQAQERRSLVRPDVVLKLPLGFGTNEEQKALIRTVMSMQPDVVLNARLRKRLDAKDVKGTALIQQLGAVFLLCVFFDAGYSTFSHLEMLKHYYLANYSAFVDKKMDIAASEYEKGEAIRTHPLPISWVTNQLLSKDPVAPGVYEARADALWSMGKKDEAINTIEQAIALSPKSFRINLRMARMLAETGDNSKAQAQIQEAMTKHKNTFLPQLYMIALKHGAPKTASPDQQLYKSYLDKLDEELFGGDDPHWPPVGSPYLADVWYKEDLQFVFDRLVGQPLK